MANIGFATLSVIPSLKGMEASLTKGLAPAQGIASAQGAKAGTQFGGKFGSQFKKILPTSFQGLSLGPLFGTAIAAGVVVGLAEIGGAVGKMKRIITQESGATGKQLTGLFETAKREALKVPASFDDIAAAVSELSRRGVPLGAQFDKLAEQELFLAKITGTELATNVEQTTGLFKKFNIPLKDQSRELDVLFKATQASGKGLGDLIGPLEKGGVSLQQFGFDLDHSIALIAGLSKAGIDSQPVLASLRKAFGQIAKEGGDPQKVLAGIIKELRDGKNPTKAMADALKLFGNRGGSELARAIQQGRLSVDGLLKSITNGKDGIIATGEATLTLADRITLLKHNAAIALAPLGSQIRTVFSDIVTQAAPAFSTLFLGIANVASGLLPALLPVGAALAGMFKLALPAIQLFADDLNTIGDILHGIPGPVIAGATAIGILGLAAFGAADGLIAMAIAGAEATIAFATTPFGAAAIAVGALVTALTIFGKHGDAAKKEAKELGKALFDSANDAGIFASGIATATSGVEAFVKAQIAAGKADDLKALLVGTGLTVGGLSAHLSAGTVAWDRYTAAIAESALKSAGVSKSQDAFAHLSGKVIGTLDKQRKAFEESAQAELATVVANGQLKQSELDAIERRRKNSDGTINYAKVLDRVNGLLAETARQTDITAQATAQASPIYAALVDQFAAGGISADQFSSILKGKFKFTAEGAKTAAKDLTAQVKALSDQVDRSFPSIGDAAKDLKNDVTGVAADLAGRQSQFASQLKETQKLGSGASKTLRDDMATNLKGIRDDFKVLADDADPARFTANLLKQIQNISTFFGSIKTLVQQGFPELARTMLDLGAQAGGSLAAGFAADKTKAKNATAALTLLDQTKGSMHQWVLSHFAELQGIGGSVVDGVTDGINAAAPRATNAGVRLVDGVKQVIKGNFRISSPSKWARDEIGKNVVEGFAQGLHPAPAIKAADTLVARVQARLAKPMQLPSPADALIARAKAAGLKLRVAQVALFRLASSPGHGPLDMAKKQVAEAQKVFDVAQGQFAAHPVAFQKYLSTLSKQRQQDFANLFRIAREQEAARSKWTAAINSTKGSKDTAPLVQATRTRFDNASFVGAQFAGTHVGNAVPRLVQYFTGTVYGDAHLKSLARAGALEALREETRNNGFVRGVRVAG